MKHTKHALTYLRRQYSAVLKHAYALGIATVIVLSLGSATANTATASTKVTDQQTANALLNNWKSEFEASHRLTTGDSPGPENGFLTK